VPIVYSQLATRKINCQALCLSGGDRLPQSVIDRWKEVSGQLIYNTSGVTEAALCYSYNKLGTPDAGTINDGYMMRVVDENNNELPYNQVGRLQIQTEYRALGYYNDPYWTEKMFGSEWISTGDYAYITELGHLNYMGRINDVIKINGKFVNPSEIEETLLNYTGIEQAAVISRTSDDDLEHIEAFLVAAPNVQLNTKDIRRHLLDKHEKHYCPRVIHLVNELPRTDTGKVQRFILKQS
jgi:acyl-coenzyme A synthetase/AMP-(fatty) acid ligase